jgi:hypothetical protein
MKDKKEERKEDDASLRSKNEHSYLNKGLRGQHCAIL